MTQQLSFARFDLINLFTQPRQYGAAFLFVVVVAAVSPIPSAGLPAAAAIVSMIVATTFAQDERGRLDTLYATLPTSRTAVVLGRYLTTLAPWAVVSVVALAASVIAPLVRGRAWQPELLAPMVLTGFAVLALTVSLQLPIFFAAGYHRARPVRYVPVFVIAALVWLVGQAGLVTQDQLSRLGEDLGSLSAVVAGVGLVLLVASAALSRTLYARRQL